MKVGQLIQYRRWADTERKDHQTDLAKASHKTDCRTEKAASDHLGLGSQTQDWSEESLSQGCYSLAFIPGTSICSVQS